SSYEKTDYAALQEQWKRFMEQIWNIPQEKNFKFHSSYENKSLQEQWAFFSGQVKDTQKENPTLSSTTDNNTDHTDLYERLTPLIKENGYRANFAAVPEKVQFNFQTIDYTSWGKQNNNDNYPNCHRKNENPPGEQLTEEGLSASQKPWKFRMIRTWGVKEIKGNPNCYRKNEKTYCEQLKEQGLFSKNTDCDSLIKTLSKKDFQEPCDEPEILTNINYCDVLKSLLSHTEFSNSECESDSCESLKSKMNLLKAVYDHNSCYRVSNNSKNICKDLQKEFSYTKSTHDSVCYESITGLTEEDEDRSDCESLSKNSPDDIYDMVCGNCFYKVCFYLWKGFPFNENLSLSTNPDAFSFQFNCVQLQPPKTVTMEYLQDKLPLLSDFKDEYHWDNYRYLSDLRQSVPENFKENFLFLKPPYHLSDSDNPPKLDK
ncbi:MAG: hypothetical protein OXB86_05175, partial [Bdellovibrionales bacterium]|nr:hypothetical protein [Bdellovibrionales bacterium]